MTRRVEQMAEPQTGDASLDLRVEQLANRAAVKQVLAPGG